MEIGCTEGYLLWYIEELDCEQPNATVGWTCRSWQGLRQSGILHQHCFVIQNVAALRWNGHALAISSSSVAIKSDAGIWVSLFLYMHKEAADHQACPRLASLTMDCDNVIQAVLRICGAVGLGRQHVQKRRQQQR